MRISDVIRDLPAEPCSGISQPFWYPFLPFLCSPLLLPHYILSGLSSRPAQSVKMDVLKEQNCEFMTLSDCYFPETLCAPSSQTKSTPKGIHECGAGFFLACKDFGENV